MLGRSSSPRETVVVQQPTTRASGNNATPDTNAAASDAQAGTADQAPATTANKSTDGSMRRFLNVVMWIAGLGLAGLLIVRARRAWLSKKASYTSHTNYRL
ncbi:hypothetical protein C5O80_37035 [Burkholderia sp. SRS-46]|nr:hypothetical protein C5O80_37035 [Burkholderia sp. SRS-46]